MESLEDLISGLIGLYVVASFIFGIIQASRKSREAAGRPAPKYRPIPQGGPRPPVFETTPVPAGRADMADTWPGGSLPAEGADPGLEGTGSSLEGQLLEGALEADAERVQGPAEDLEEGVSGEALETEWLPALEGSASPAEGTAADARGGEGGGLEEGGRDFLEWEDERLWPCEEAVRAPQAVARGRTTRGDESYAPQLAMGLSREDLVFGIFIREVLGPPVSLRLSEARLRAAMERALREGQ